MRLIRQLDAADRRLPSFAGALVGATAAAVLVTATAAAFVKDAPAAKVARSAPTASPSASASAKAKPKPKPTATKPPKPDDPSDYILDVAKALPGWDRIDDDEAGAGKMTLEDAAVIEAGGDRPSEADRDALRDLGFVRGHARAWLDDDGNTLVVFVYEWKDKQAPLKFVQGMKYVNEGTAGWQPKTPRSYGVCKLQKEQTYDGAVVAVGKHSFLMVTLRDGGCRTHEPVARVLDLVAKHATALGA
ncbi:MAG TPA: hypothetical protein VGX28_04470 [Frankiaceae bacterium]|nr:hypothetical protein [Frankiaceae bacterium]